MYAGGLILTWLSNNQAISGIETRYITFYMPATLVVLAMVVLDLIERPVIDTWVALRLKRPNPSAGRYGLILVLGVALPFLWLKEFLPQISGSYSSTYLPLHYHYSFLQRVVDDIYASFGYTADELRRSIAMGSILPGGNLSIWHNEYHSLSYVASYRQPTSPRPYDGCVLVVEGDGGERRGEVLAAAGKTLQLFLGSTQIEVPVNRVVARSDYILVGYPSFDGNCLRSYANLYNLAPEERIIASQAKGMAVDSARALGSQSGESSSYLVHLPRSESAVDGGRDVSLVIRLTRTEGGIATKLLSDSLAGFLITPPTSSIWQPLLRFTPLDGGTPQVLPVSEGELGSNSYFITPWVTRAVTVPKGRYRLDFEARMDRQGPVHRIELSPSFEMN